MARRPRSKHTNNEPSKLTRFAYGDSGRPFYNNPAVNGVAMIESLYLRRFTELSINRFQWKNLPEEIDERYLEMNLLRSSLAVFYYDDHYQKYMCLPGSAQGFLDMQDNPVRFNVHGNQLYNKMLDAEDVVPIWANRTRVPDHDVMLWYARRLGEVETTVDINVKSARLTRLLAASENMRLSVSNILRQIDQGNPVIPVDSDMLDENFLTVLDMGVNPEQIVSVQMVKNRMFNDAMTFLGVNNSNQDKKERLVSDEVDSNAEQVLLNRSIALSARKTAAKKINERFKLNVSVDWNDELKPKPETESGDDDGRVYDDAERDQ